MLQSILDQPLIQGDEVLVVGDGPQPQARELVRQAGEPFRYLEHGPDHCWGDGQRNFAMPLARGQYLVFCDDDNALLPGAFNAIRQAAAEFPGRPLIFRIRFLSGHIAPSAPRLKCSDYDTACGAWPNVPGRLGKWGRRYEGDYLFARSTLDLYPNRDQDAVFRRELIAAHRPHLLPPNVLPAFKSFAPKRVPDAASVVAQARGGESMEL
jgi:glycosyltransferase involved in cell wall biosynthesis